MSAKLFVFIPAYGQTISATTFLSSHALMPALAGKGISGGLSTLSFPDIAELRNMVTTIWYDTIPDATHLLFIDADMGFPPELVLDMLLFDEPIVGAIYAQRQLPTSWAGSGTGGTTAERRGDFMRVEGVGMGCCLIRREVITKLLERFPQVSDERLDLHPAQGIMKDAGAKRIIRVFDKIDIPERGIVSEDLSFCIRWGMCGGQVWANIGHRLSHVGPFDYGHRYLDMTQQSLIAVPRVQAQDQIIATTNAPVAPLEVVQTKDEPYPAPLPPMIKAKKGRKRNGEARVAA